MVIDCRKLFELRQAAAMLERLTECPSCKHMRDADDKACWNCGAFPVHHWIEQDRR